MNKESASRLLEEFKDTALKIIAGEDISFQKLHVIDLILGCNIQTTTLVTREELEDLKVTKEIYPLLPKLEEVYENRQRKSQILGQIY